jgi:uncharacterized protein YbbK (DUF523 family)
MFLIMVNNKIKIAVSSCLLGEAVRYDGTDKHVEYITQQLAQEYTLISLCPEMAVGMGVPRPPIHLVNNGNTVEVLGIDNPSTNMTKLLAEYGQEVLHTHPDICGYIFKKNSPSCGTKNVKVFNTASGQYERQGQGIYAAAITKAFPLLPIIDEDDCLDKKSMNAFLLDIKKYANSI